MTEIWDSLTCLLDKNTNPSWWGCQFISTIEINFIYGVTRLSRKGNNRNGKSKSAKVSYLNLPAGCDGGTTWIELEGGHIFVELTLVDEVTWFTNSSLFSGVFSIGSKTLGSSFCGVCGRSASGSSCSVSHWVSTVTNCFALSFVAGKLAKITLSSSSFLHLFTNDWIWSFFDNFIIGFQKGSNHS